MENKIVIKGLRQNNLKNVSLEIPKEKIVVFTGVSGSGKSSIVFDTIAAVRLLFSRIGTPYVGTASYFSFNDPNGMCMECAGIGKVMEVDYKDRIDPEKSWNEGMLDLPAYHVGNWYWKQYAESGLISLDKKYKDYTEKEKNILLYGAYEKGGEAQRLKLVRYMGSALTGMTYIFDEPSTGMHPRDVHRMSKLLMSLRDKGNTVLVVDQSPVTATGRSNPATFLGFFDEIRKVMAEECGASRSLFTFNGAGACPYVPEEALSLLNWCLWTR